MSALPESERIPTVPFWINGRRVDPERGRRMADVTNPATGAVTRRVALATREDVDVAVSAAAAAFPAWRDTTPLRRSRILQAFLRLLVEHKHELAALASEEHGKTVSDALGSVQRGLEVVEFACGIPQLLKGEHAENVGSGIDSWSRRQPLGVCAGITPFNFPVMVPMWMFPMAIACGNAFVLKPSEKVPSCSVLLAELFAQAGLPKGIFNVIHGDREAVDALLENPQVAAVSFVGSTAVAKHVYETGAKSGKRVQALGGAKNHAVVLPDADMEFTADAIAGAAYGSAGERCMAISVVVAVGDAADPLLELLAKRARSIAVGPSDAASIDMGPLVSAAHRDRVSGFIDRGIAEGAKLVVDGRGLRIPGYEKGFFLGPALFDHVEPSMSIYREEIFGPVLGMVRVGSLDEAIALINRNPYANGTAIFTDSGSAARVFEAGIEVGMVGINVPIPVPMAFLSFGGWKGSLFGDTGIHGAEGIRFYTRSKVVTARWPSASRAKDAASPMVMPTH